MYDIAPMAEKFAYDYLKNNTGEMDPDVVHRLPFKRQPPCVCFWCLILMIHQPAHLLAGLKSW